MIRAGYGAGGGFSPLFFTSVECVVVVSPPGVVTVFSSFTTAVSSQPVKHTEASPKHINEAIVSFFIGRILLKGTRSLRRYISEGNRSMQSGDRCVLELQLRDH